MFHSSERQLARARIHSNLRRRRKRTKLSLCPPVYFSSSILFWGFSNRYRIRYSHSRYSDRLDQRVSDRSVREKGSHCGVMRLRNHRDGASGITLSATGAEFWSKKSGMAADPSDDTFHDDVHRSDTGSEHHTQRAFPRRFKEHRRIHCQHHVRVIRVHL